MTKFDDIVDIEGLSPDEEARLRRVHDLLVQAGPPPDLPPTLEHPATPTEAEIVQFPLLPRRRWAVAFVAAAALALVAFAGGYFLGHSKGKPATFVTQRVVAMHGKTSLAVLKLGWRDSAGNWPMQLEINGLPKQRDPAAYYELWLTRNGKADTPCGTFRVHGDTTTVRLSVPYSFSNFDGWVVTSQPATDHGAAGPVFLTT
jgi:Anti-sigma-K factor rskA